MRVLALICAVFLAACQFAAPPGAIGKGKTDPDAFAGGKIEVTTLDGKAVGKIAAPKPVKADAPKPEPKDVAAPSAEAKPLAETKPPAAPTRAEKTAPKDASDTKPKATETAPPKPEEPATPAVQKTAGQISCEKKGGTWGGAGKSGAKTCISPTGDGGKQCRKQGDCEGACLARSGTCAPIKPLFGCNEVFQADGQRVTLCID